LFSVKKAAAMLTAIPCVYPAEMVMYRRTDEGEAADRRSSWPQWTVTGVRPQVICTLFPKSDVWGFRPIGDSKQTPMPRGESAILILEKKEVQPKNGQMVVFPRVVP
jgi:hypothetical protein